MEDTQEKKSFFEIFAQFAKGIGLEDLAFDDNGDCELLFGNDLVINMHHDQEMGIVMTYAIATDIGGIPNRQEFLIKMLRSNFFWMENKGFTVSLDYEKENVMVMDRQSEDYFKSADALATYLGACADVVYDWRRKINAQYQDALLAENPEMLEDEPEAMAESADDGNDDATPLP